MLNEGARGMWWKKQGWAPRPRKQPGRSKQTVATVALAVGIGAFVINIAAAKAAVGKVHWAVVASQTIPAGSPISPNEVSLQRLQGVKHTLTSLHQVSGLVALHTIVAGEPITAPLVSRLPLRLGIKPHEVGLWIGVNLVTSALVQPGNIVDVLFASNASGGSTTAQQTIAALQGQIILTGVRVVEVANSNGQVISTATTTKSNTVTNAANATVPAAVELAITAHQAVTLVQAESLGTLTLVEDPWNTSTPTTHLATATTAPATTAPTTQAP